MGFVSQVLKALVGDVVIGSRTVEGKAKPELVARFAINAIPALAELARGGAERATVQRLTREPSATSHRLRSAARQRNARWLFRSHGGAIG